MKKHKDALSKTSLKRIKRNKIDISEQYEVKNDGWVKK